MHWAYSRGTETPPQPFFVYIAVNNRCNLRCKMCDIGCEQRNSNIYANLRSRKHDIDFSDLKKVITQFKGSNSLLIFNSTEPLLYPQIVGAVDYVKKNGLTCKIATNGFLLPELADDLVKARLDILTVSVDGPEEVHDRIRGVKGSYQKIVDGVQKVIDYKRKTGDLMPMLQVNSTISEYNYNCILETLAGLRDFGLEKIFLSHLNVVTPKMRREHNSSVPWYRTNIRSSISPKNIDTSVLYSQLREARKKYGYLNIRELPYLDKTQLEVYYNDPERKLSISRKCHFPWFSAQILANGDVVPIMRCMPIVLGNVFEREFMEIWNGEAYQLLRKRLNIHRFFPACRRCCGIFT